MVTCGSERVNIGNLTLNLLNVENIPFLQISFLKCQWIMVFFPDLHFHSYISKKDVQFWFLNGFERIHYYNYEIMTPHEELNLRNSVALASTRRKKPLFHFRVKNLPSLLL